MEAEPSDKTAPRVSVVVVAYNSRAYIARVLEALARQTFTDFDVIIFDNASSDGGLDGIAPPPNARVVRSEENLGFAAGNNRAAELSDAPYLALLNPDAFPEPEWLERLVAAADAHPKAASIASLQLTDADPSVLDGAGDVLHVAGIPYRGGFGSKRPERLEPGDVFGPCAAAALYKREAFDAAGGFDESFFCYCEDVDLAYRLRLAGWTCVFEPRAVVRHVGSGITGRRSKFAVEHGVRNRTWALWKNTPAALLVLMVPLHMIALVAIFLQGLVRGHGAARSTLVGLWRGLRGLARLTAERRRVLHARKASIGDIARAMTWSPLKLAKRGMDVKRFPSGAADHSSSTSISTISGSDT